MAEEYTVRVESLPKLPKDVSCFGCYRTSTHQVRNVQGYVIQYGCSSCCASFAMELSKRYAHLAQTVRGFRPHSYHRDRDKADFETLFDEGTGRYYDRERDIFNTPTSEDVSKLVRQAKKRAAVREAMKKWQDEM